MKNLSLAAALLSTSLLAPVLAHSADDDNPSGAYLGAGWGRFNLDIRNLSDVGTATRDIAKSDDNAWKIFAGYRFIPYFALEGAYINFGKTGDRFQATTANGSNGNYRVDLSGFAPYAVGAIPLGPVELFAKVGEYFYNVKVRADFDNPGPDLDSSHSRSDLLYGGGVGVTLFDRVHLRGEYETVDIKNARNSDAFWLSAAWRF